MLTEDFFSRHPVACATGLIGCELHWDRCSGIIVEAEAYTALGDEACHTFLRRGAQKFVDIHPAGTAYIYLNYGIHWLLNVLIKGDMDGFVLIRALEPQEGLPLMRERRKLEDNVKLCSGPGKLTQALAISPTFHGSSLCHDPRRSFHARAADAPATNIVSDVRIGISRAGGFTMAVFGRGQPVCQPCADRCRKKSRAIPGEMTRPVKDGFATNQRFPPARRPKSADRARLLAARSGGGRRDSGGAGRSLRRTSVEAAQGGCRQSNKGHEFDGLHILLLVHLRSRLVAVEQTLDGRGDFATRIGKQFSDRRLSHHVVLIVTSVPGLT